MCVWCLRQSHACMHAHVHACLVRGERERRTGEGREDGRVGATTRYRKRGDTDHGEDGTVFACYSRNMCHFLKADVLLLHHCSSTHPRASPQCASRARPPPSPRRRLAARAARARGCTPSLSLSRRLRLRVAAGRFAAARPTDSTVLLLQTARRPTPTAPTSGAIKPAINATPVACKSGGHHFGLGHPLVCASQERRDGDSGTGSGETCIRRVAHHHESEEADHDTHSDHHAIVVELRWGPWASRGGLGLSGGGE